MPHTTLTENMGQTRPLPQPGEPWRPARLGSLTGSDWIGLDRTVCTVPIPTTLCWVPAQAFPPGPAVTSPGYQVHCVCAQVPLSHHAPSSGGRPPTRLADWAGPLGERRNHPPAVLKRAAYGCIHSGVNPSGTSDSHNSPRGHLE